MRCCHGSVEHRRSLLGTAGEAELLDAGVACLPGTSFGSFGEGYLRFSYANSVENIEKALAAMKKALPKLTLAAAR